MSDKYILKDKVAVLEPDLLTWAKWFESTENRIVRKCQIGDSEVSTVFLGIDHAFGGGQPLLFETMVFGGPLDEEQRRCSTWEEAEAMHDAVCECVRAAA